MRVFMLFLIGLTFGAAGGFVVAAANGITFDGHDHSDPAHHGGMDHAKMHDQPLELDGAAAPDISIIVTKDRMSGHNLQLVTENFTFAPMAASSPHVAGQGHAHVYANGVKLGRVYGPWMHLDALPAGEVEIEVTLNANDHRQFTVGGKPVSAITTIDVE